MFCCYPDEQIHAVQKTEDTILLVPKPITTFETTDNSDTIASY